MPALTATLRRAAAESTLELPFRIPPKEWFSCREVGLVFGLAESTVEKLYDLGRFPVRHAHNAGDGGKTREKRMHKRIHRLSVIAYALETADRYDDASLDDALVACLRHLDPKRLLALAERLRGLAHR